MTMVLGNIDHIAAPKLAIVQVGNIEVKNKVKDCEEVGIIADIYQYPEDITEYELCENIKLDQEHYDGVIIQLPLPPHIRERVVVAAINPLKNVNSLYDLVALKNRNILNRVSLKYG